MTRVTVPLDEDLADQLSQLARQNLRSTGAEAAHIIRAHFAPKLRPAKKGTQMRKGAAV